MNTTKDQQKQDKDWEKPVHNHSPAKEKPRSRTGTLLELDRKLLEHNGTLLELNVKLLNHNVTLLKLYGTLLEFNVTLLGSNRNIMGHC